MVGALDRNRTGKLCQSISWIFTKLLHTYHTEREARQTQYAALHEALKVGEGKVLTEHLDQHSGVTINVLVLDQL